MTKTHAVSTRPRWIWIVAAAVIVAAGIAAVWAFAASRASADAADLARQGDASVDGPPAPRPDGLPAETTLGITELVVRDLPGVLAYYRDAIGLEVIEQTDSTALLGQGAPLVSLRSATDASPAATDAGLYHTAILYADESTLAAALGRVARTAPESYQGSADHSVSLAFYLADPEGNGVELYVDRPREDWVWADGQVRMGSAALDPNAFLQEHGATTGAGTASLGHMHLKVGDLDAARAFYADTLGFDVVSEADGALFYSAGGYHHHLATNTWQSSGAGVRSTPVGLGFVTVTLPDQAGVDAVAARLADAGHPVDSVDQGIATSDPWGNVVQIVVATT